MNGTISLAEELRAIRGVGNGKTLFKRKAEPEASERPWQSDIDHVQQTLQEVLQAISQLSGVELPGVAPDSKGTDNSAPRPDCETLKDRIRNDLEAFSVTTAAELAKQAEEQTRAALGAVQTEVSSQVDQVASEFRTKLQEQFRPEQLEVDLAQQSRDRVAELVQTQTDEFAHWVWLTCKGTGAPIPLQVEKMLGPYVEEATAKFENAFRQKVQDLLAEQERLSQEKLQVTTSSFKNQISALEQASLQVCEQNADSVTTKSLERLNATAEEAAKNFEGRVNSEVEDAIGRFQARMDETATTSQQAIQRQEEQSEVFRLKLEELAGEVQQKRVSEITDHIAQTAANVIESSVQHLHQQADDAVVHSKGQLTELQLQMEEVRQQTAELGRSAHESLSQDAGRLAESLRRLDEELSAIEKKHVAASEQQLSNLIQGTVKSLTTQIRQVADAQVEEIAKFAQETREKATSQYESRLQEVMEGQYQSLVERIQKDAGEASAKVAAEVNSTSQSVVQELLSEMNASVSTLREETSRATSRIESCVGESLEAYRQQLAQITDTGLQEQRKAITGSMADLHDRLKQAAELLVQGNL